MGSISYATALVVASPALVRVGGRVSNMEDFVIHNTTLQDLNNSCRYGHPFWVLISQPISEILLKLNSSVNFFIYCAFNNCFRKVIRNRFKSVISLWTYAQHNSTRTRNSSNASRTINDQTNVTTINATELMPLNNTCK